MTIDTDQKPKFGDRVEITRKLVRRYDTFTSSKIWVDVEHVAKGCIFLGYRTVSNGRREWLDECGYTYSPTGHFRVAVVCPGEHRNQLYVPVDAIIVEADFLKG